MGAGATVRHVGTGQVLGLLELARLVSGEGCSFSPLLPCMRGGADGCLHNSGRAAVAPASRCSSCPAPRCEQVLWRHFPAMLGGEAAVAVGSGMHGQPSGEATRQKIWGAEMGFASTGSAEPACQPVSAPRCHVAPPPVTVCVGMCACLSLLKLEAGMPALAPFPGAVNHTQPSVLPRGPSAV